MRLCCTCRGPLDAHENYESCYPLYGYLFSARFLQANCLRCFAVIERYAKSLLVEEDWSLKGSKRIKFSRLESKRRIFVLSPEGFAMAQAKRVASVLVATTAEKKRKSNQRIAISESRSELIKHFVIEFVSGIGPHSSRQTTEMTDWHGIAALYCQRAALRRLFKIFRIKTPGLASLMTADDDFDNPNRERGLTIIQKAHERAKDNLATADAILHKYLNPLKGAPNFYPDWNNRGWHTNIIWQAKASHHISRRLWWHKIHAKRERKRNLPNELASFKYFPEHIRG